MIIGVIAVGTTVAVAMTVAAVGLSRRLRAAIVLVLLALALGAAAPELPHWEQVLTVASEHFGGPTATEPPGVYARAVQPDLRIVAVGDVGTGDRYEQQTADLAAELGRHDPFDALVLLGDNVYPSGDPDRLDATVFGPFANVLDRGADLVAVLGNHDVADGHGDAQAAALGMPGRWYAHRIGGVLLVALDSTRPDDPDQLAWLDATLASTTATWKIAALHHPPYSAGYHGSDAAARAAFAPRFAGHGVQLVLSGHDHDYQRSTAIDGVTYVVSGGGAKVRPTGREDFTIASYSVRHVVDIWVWPDRLEVHAVSRAGVFDSFALAP